MLLFVQNEMFLYFSYLFLVIILNIEVVMLLRKFR